MRFGNYSLLVNGGVEKESGYVALMHGSRYSITLISHDHRRSDAEVRIDGKDCGTFRLDAHGSAKLETVPGDGGCFTFYSSGTTEASVSGESSVQQGDRGLIQVTFTPEKVRPVSQYTMRSLTSRGGQVFNSCEKTVGGITGMSGHSDQQFHTVGPIEHDLSGRVTISLRLVTLQDGPRPLLAVKSLPIGNVVPPPV